MGEERGDRMAAGALDVHIERVGGLDHPLELVGLSFSSRRGVEEIDGQSHFCCVCVCVRKWEKKKQKLRDAAAS